MKPVAGIITRCRHHSAARILWTLLIASLSGLSLLLYSATPGAQAPKADYRVGDRLPQAKAKGPANASKTSYAEIPWEKLVPAGWDPAKFFRGMDLSQFNDSDPRAMEALEKLREAWDNAPSVPELNGTRIRIPGFVVPLENHRNQITEFLLVPYFGACIHVPPPPSNQIIHVFPAQPLKGTRTMDAVWVSGVLETAVSRTGMGTAGYRLKAGIITPYKKP